jgi:hypothetical protein
MRKILFLFLITILSNTYGQITTTSIKKDTPKTEFIYDGSVNYLGENAMGYEGQVLYVNGISEGLQGWGYSDFSTELKFDSYRNKIYKCCSEKSPYNSKYSEVFGKYFTVDKVIPHPKANELSIYKDEFFFEMTEKESGEKVYYKYSARFNHGFHFIVVKHFEYLKDLYVGKKYRISFSTMKNLETNKEEAVKPADLWTIEDVTVDDKEYKIKLVAVNSTGFKTLLNIDYLTDSKPNRMIMNETDYNKYLKKFGAKKWNRIFVDREYYIGDTEEVVRLVKGNPNSINYASYGDQWVYDYSYLYFKNGIYTSYN